MVLGIKIEVMNGKTKLITSFASRYLLQRMKSHKFCNLLKARIFPKSSGVADSMNKRNSVIAISVLRTTLLAYNILAKKIIVSSTNDYHTTDEKTYDIMSELKAFDNTKVGVKGLVDAGITKVP
ncbi:hypothetical protein CQW23_28204 [Capsicum baccatum]|uniref:Uncharacterized protein n=1 Tax=Capsicum baccatum TaxID=33114 RepID=A0A2G2VFY7_CAPBA|nr:hypothetical protein CQW23_28204 [Capsicum baccatum]